MAQDLTYRFDEIELDGAVISLGFEVEAILEWSWKQALPTNFRIWAASFVGAGAFGRDVPAWLVAAINRWLSLNEAKMVKLWQANCADEEAA